MDEYIISLDLISRRHTLAQISRVMGVSPSKSSAERGEAVPFPISRLRKRRELTVWRLEPLRRNWGSLDSQLRSLLRVIPSDLKRRVHAVGLTEPPLISVAVFTSRAMRTVIIPPDCLAKISGLGCDLGIVYYDTKDR
jgi:hypothetical protein